QASKRTQQPSSQEQTSESVQQPSSERDNGRSSDPLSGRDAIERVRTELPELLGRPIEGVLGLQRDDGGWKVTVQAVELARIPRSTDVLGSYEVVLDGSGELTGYKRTRRFSRGQADED
ncbi:MAG: gas vesicle protein, partial [Actinomycetota bacterium]|nr:gas vesicle protein [Actinomycetota bacterium]